MLRDRGSEKCTRPSETRRVGQVVNSSTRLRDHNFPECPDHVVGGAGGKEQSVGWTIGSRAASEIDCPELVNVYNSTRGVFHSADERARLRIERVDGAIVRVV